MNPILKQLQLPGSKLTRKLISRSSDLDMPVFEQLKLDLTIEKTSSTPIKRKKRR